MPEEGRGRTRRDAGEYASKPKRTPTAYILYQREVGASVRDRHGAEWTREVSKMWNGLSKSEKDRFYHEAAELSAAQKRLFPEDNQVARHTPTQFFQYQPHPSNESADAEVGQAAETSAHHQNPLEWRPVQIDRFHQEMRSCKVPSIIPEESRSAFNGLFGVFDSKVPQASTSNHTQRYIEPEMPSQGGSAEKDFARFMIPSEIEEAQHTYHSHKSHDNSSSLSTPHLRVPSPSPTPSLEASSSGWRSPSTAAVPTPASARFESSLLEEQNSWMPECLHYPQPYGLQTSSQYPSNAGFTERFPSVVSQSSALSWSTLSASTFEAQDSSLQPAGVGQVEDFSLPDVGHRVHNQMQMNQDGSLLEHGGLQNAIEEPNVGELESENGASFFGFNFWDNFLPHADHGANDQTQLGRNNFVVVGDGSYNVVGQHHVGELESGNGASFSGFNVGDVFLPHANHQDINQTQLNQDDVFFGDDGSTYVVGEQHVGGLDNEDAA